MKSSFWNKFLVTPTKINFPNYKFDLHVHSQNSDGKLFPKELIESARKNNIKLISITDHQTIDSYKDELFQNAKKNNIDLLPGIEIECQGELDILIYDLNPNEISQEFKLKINELLTYLNKKRNKYILESINKIKEVITTSKDFDWIVWDSFNDLQKNNFWKQFNFENASKIDLETGELNLPNRTYVSKPHLAKLLSTFGVIDMRKVDSSLNYQADEKNKFIQKHFIDKVIGWGLNDLSFDYETLKLIKELPFIKIIAHPGKPFERWNNSNDEKEFINFLESLFVFNMDGIEGDYRHYKEMGLNYNKVSKIYLKNRVKAKNTVLFCTGGSDSHKNLD